MSESDGDADSRTYRTFCRLGVAETTPSKSTLAANIKALRAETLEQVHRLILSLAKASGVEKRSRETAGTFSGQPRSSPIT